MLFRRGYLHRRFTALLTVAHREYYRIALYKLSAVDKIVITLDLKRVASAACTVGIAIEIASVNTVKGICCTSCRLFRVILECIVAIAVLCYVKSVVIGKRNRLRHE